MITVPAKLAALQARQREQADRERARLGVEARSWYRISNAASADEAEVMLYDEIGGWFGSTADELIAELKQITAPRMRVRINSPGGSVFEGIAIANALRAHPAAVTVQVDSIAASIASVIAMSGDRIEMAPNSMLMIHDASGVCMGNASDMEEMAELLDLISDNIADAYAARAGGTRDEWRARMRAETWYLPEDAVDAGLADEALAVPKAGTPAAEPDEGEPEPEMARAWDLAAYGYHGPRGEEPKAEAGLTEDIRSLIGEEIAAQLRAAVTPHAEDTAGAPAAPAPEPAVEPEPEAPAVEPVDEWAAMVAHLTKDEPDAWSVLVSNLTTTTASSSAATEA
ncbi:head maturation protease, ClpP-related [Streptomyces bangladeshensis]|uniref:ATP-dependent Clp protease proteolytic subunit n=1 Tax=Streptomyces bangladeshensis TaxID=295352 RepID=A0ABP5NP24_9ACTN